MHPFSRVDRAENEVIKKARAISDLHEYGLGGVCCASWFRDLFDRVKFRVTKGRRESSFIDTNESSRVSKFKLARRKVDLMFY